MIFLGRLLSNNSFEIKVVQEDYRTFKFVSIRSILIIVRNILNYPLSFLKVLVLVRFKRCFFTKVQYIYFKLSAYSLLYKE